MIVAWSETSAIITSIEIPQIHYFLIKIPCNNNKRSIISS